MSAVLCRKPACDCFYHQPWSPAVCTEDAKYSLSVRWKPEMKTICFHSKSLLKYVCWVCKAQFLSVHRYRKGSLNLFVGVFHANYGRPRQSDNNHSNAFWWFLAEHPLCNWFHQETANNLEKLLTNWLWNAHFSIVTSGFYGVVNWSVSLCNWHLNLKLLEVGSYLLHTHKSLILAISIFPKLKN